jgi:porin
VQSLTKETSVIAGKISDVFIPDQTLFGNSYKYYFANFNLNKNPMTTNFYGPVALAALATWSPNQAFTLGAGVLDPNSKADNFAIDAFESQNYYVTAILTYNLGGLPGQASPAYNWSNKPLIDFTRPFGALSPAQIQEAVGAVLGGPDAGLPVNRNTNSWFLIGNIAQYLYVEDDAKTIAHKLKSGQPLDGIGIFARFGYAPPETNRVTRDASVALFAHGLQACRPYDSFGVGYFYNEFSGDLKESLAALTLNSVNLKNESGVEAFYDFAVTPAIRVIPSYQHIWQPFFAQVETRQSEADIFLTRVTAAW